MGREKISQLLKNRFKLLNIPYINLVPGNETLEQGEQQRRKMRICKELDVHYKPIENEAAHK